MSLLDKQLDVLEGRDISAEDVEKMIKDFPSKEKLQIEHSKTSKNIQSLSGGNTGLLERRLRICDKALEELLKRGSSEWKAKVGSILAAVLLFTEQVRAWDRIGLNV